MALVDVNWNPSSRHLRQFALIGAGLLLAVAAWSWLSRGESVAVWCLAIVALGVGLCGGLWPEMMRYPYLGLTFVTFPIGWVVSHVLLGVIYYGVFTFVALIFRLIGRDALQRRFEPALASYWQPKKRPKNMRQYFHQF